MAYGIVILVITIILSLIIIGVFDKKYERVNSTLLRGSLAMHVLLTFTYYAYAYFNRSDSHYYYQKVLYDYRGPTWFDFYGTSTTFIEWVGYPFIKYFGFTYEATMFLFSFFGFLGFIYFYLFFIENIRFKHKLLGVNIFPIIFLLPNLHFWSASFGKGSLIFFSIALVFYGVSNPTKRLLPLIIGAIITYHVRPHVMFVLLASGLIAFTFSSKGISTSVRVGLILIAGVSFFFIYRDVLAMVGISEGQELTQGLDLTRRAQELTDATSGVDITSYSLPYQVFTFLFRPLFFDAPGMLGLIVSVENVFYLAMAVLLLRWRNLKHLIFGDYLTKMAFFSFLAVSIALAQIAGNLGIAIRQKSQIIPLFLFVILSTMDQVSREKYKKKASPRRRQVIGPLRRAR